MTQEMNLCLLCCYAFEERPNRFITDDARRCLSKFGSELGCPITSPSSTCSLNSGGGSGSKSVPSLGSLKLPFGERITVCGDCLNLIVMYVNRKAVQKKKEERLLELQKAVLGAMNELNAVVNDVQEHIDRLQSTVRMGNDSALESFVGRDHSPAERGRESKAKKFRKNVLAMTARADMLQQNDTLVSQGNTVQIKDERLEEPSNRSGSLGDSDSDARVDNFFMNENDDDDDDNLSDNNSNHSGEEDTKQNNIRSTSPSLTTHVTGRSGRTTLKRDHNSKSLIEELGSSDSDHKKEERDTGAPKAKRSKKKIEKVKKEVKPKEFLNPASIDISSFKMMTTNPKGNRHSISLKQKLDIIKLLELGNSQTMVAQQIGLQRQTITRIWADKEKIKIEENRRDNNHKRCRRVQFDKIDQQLYLWFENHADQNHAITRSVIMEKANQLATQLNVTDFKGSNGWLDKWKKRHNISRKTLSSRESGSTEGSATAEEGKVKGSSSVERQQCCHCGQFYTKYWFLARHMKEVHGL